MKFSNAKPATSIKGLSEVRRLPRLGKIRLGVKKKSANGKEYPAEVDYFVCPPEIQKVYGEKPLELDIMFPVEDTSMIFPQAYKWYTATSLKCKGDGEVAMRAVKDLSPEQKNKLGPDLPEDKESLVEVDCPCPLLESGECSQRGSLMVLLPNVSMGGVYQIDTGSIHNIIRINSALDYTRGMAGRIALVPLKLRRVKEEVEHEGKRRAHYLLTMEFKATLDQVRELRNNSNLILDNVSRLAIAPPLEEPAVPGIPHLPQEAETVSDEPTAGQMAAWNDEPEAPPAPAAAPPPAEKPILSKAPGSMTKDQSEAITETCKRIGMDGKGLTNLMASKQLPKWKDLSSLQASVLLGDLEAIDR